jgi:hypothetical protein
LRTPPFPKPPGSGKKERRVRKARTRMGKKKIRMGKVRTCVGKKEGSAGKARTRM